MKFTLTNDFKKIKDISRRILECLNEKQVDDAFLFDVKLACEEAMINAIKYGNKGRTDKIVSISCDIKESAVVIAVCDEGQGFDYRNLPDPTKPENLLKSGDRGLFLIRNIMDKVEFNSKGNKITMTKLFPKGKEAEKCR